MAAIRAETIWKIESAQNEMEPQIVDMIKGSNRNNCPYRMLKEDYPEKEETKGIVTAIARMLYKNNMLDKLDISLSDEASYDAIAFAFRYWGGNILSKYGSKICNCEDKCYK